MPVTIKDVARESGVNTSTVSRALNNAYGVNEKTRQHVMEVASRIHYRPNHVARGLVTGRSQTIGLVVSDIRNPFFAEVARGAEDAAYRAGRDLVLCNSDLRGDKQMDYFDSLLAKRVDGIVMNSVAALSIAQQDQLWAAGVPIVLLNRSSVHGRFSSVLADNMAGGAMAGNYLIDCGHTKVGHITGPRAHGNLTDRAKGFLKVFHDRGLPEPKVIRGKHTFAGGYELTHQLLQTDGKITAIFAGNDVLAFGCIRAAVEKGIRIPDDLSIIGFDNVEMSQITNPPLTTIDQPKYEIGEAAIEMLLNMMTKDGIREPEHRIIGVRLIERQSCRRISGSAGPNRPNSRSAKHPAAVGPARAGRAETEARR
ncbi:MAG TPA: LacI family DNA-binding transcriptional regulator [Terriglobia bacterium]|nr:LacI family DNA-binding transcriptional regulator [Terriglobia bacterium]